MKKYKTLTSEIMYKTLLGMAKGKGTPLQILKNRPITIYLNLLKDFDVNDLW